MDFPTCRHGSVLMSCEVVSCVDQNDFIEELGPAIEDYVKRRKNDSIRFELWLKGLKVSGYEPF